MRTNLLDALVIFLLLCAGWIGYTQSLQIEEDRARVKLQQEEDRAKYVREHTD